MSNSLNWRVKNIQDSKIKLPLSHEPVMHVVSDRWQTGRIEYPQSRYEEKVSDKLQNEEEIYMRFPIMHKSDSTHKPKYSSIRYTQNMRYTQKFRLNQNVIYNMNAIYNQAPQFYKRPKPKHAAGAYLVKIGENTVYTMDMLKVSKWKLPFTYKVLHNIKNKVNKWFLCPYYVRLNGELSDMQPCFTGKSENQTNLLNDLINDIHEETSIKLFSVDSTNHENCLIYEYGVQVQGYVSEINLDTSKFVLESDSIKPKKKINAMSRVGGIVYGSYDTMINLFTKLKCGKSQDIGAFVILNYKTFSKIYELLKNEKMSMNTFACAVQN